MALGFLPSREAMCREVECWIAQQDVDTLLRLCNCCIYKTFDLILAGECRICIIRNGIRSIVRDRSQECSEASALLTA